jgi:hypothetical protein
MERSSEVSQYTPSRRGSLSDMLIHAHIVNELAPTNYEDWIRSVVKVAKEVYPYHPNEGSRKMENVWLRQGVFFIVYWRWQGKASLKTIGKVVAQHLGRSLPFNHTTVIHAHKKHRDFMRFPKANIEYVILFTTFRELLKERNLI